MAVTKKNLLNRTSDNTYFKSGALNFGSLGSGTNFTSTTTRGVLNQVASIPSEITMRQIKTYVIS